MKISEEKLRNIIRRNLIKTSGKTLLSEGVHTPFVNFYKVIKHRYSPRVAARNYDPATGRAIDDPADFGKASGWERSLVKGVGYYGGGATITVDLLDQVFQTMTGESAAMWIKRALGPEVTTGEYHLLAACWSQYANDIDGLASDTSGTSEFFAEAEFDHAAVSPVSVNIGGKWRGAEDPPASLAQWTRVVNFIGSGERWYNRIPGYMWNDQMELDGEEIAELNLAVESAKALGSDLSLYDLSFYAPSSPDAAESIVGAYEALGMWGTQAILPNASKAALGEFVDWLKGLPSFYVTYINENTGMVEETTVSSSEGSMPLNDAIVHNIKDLLGRTSILNDMQNTALAELGRTPEDAMEISCRQNPGGEGCPDSEEGGVTQTSPESFNWALEGRQASEKARDDIQALLSRGGEPFNGSFGPTMSSRVKQYVLSIAGIPDDWKTSINVASNEMVGKPPIRGRTVQRQETMNKLAHIIRDQGIEPEGEAGALTTYVKLLQSIQGP